MSATCDAAAERVTTYLGIPCRHANPFLTLRNPFDLYSWTMPVLELMIISGAVFAFVHALRRLRRDGDATNLALWFASLVYLFVTEPPLYFPGWFGLDKQFGFIFAHNGFTVQFMYDRLPLYIVAIYPAMSQLTYEIVRALGIVQRGPARAAVCAALVCQVFYEVFDQLGPQLKWWAWNLDNKENHPLLASVPLNSIMIFASVSFGVLTYLVLKLVGQPTAAGRQLRTRSLVWRTIVAGALAPLGMGIASAPGAVFAGKHPNTTAEAVVLTIEISAVWVVGATVLVRHWLAGAERPARSAFVRIFPVAYLSVMAVLWAGALPDFVGARGGMTRLATPIGNAPFTLLCFLAACACLVAVHNPRRSAPANSVADAQVASAG